jgi:uncharacterized protein (TIGR03437 family)
MGTYGLYRLAAALCFLAALPAADFTTYIGDTNDYRVARVVADASGNTYVAGSRDGGIFVMKLDTTGKIVLFATLSGKGTDQPNDLAVDTAGNLYVAGSTGSTLLPLRNALQSTPGPGFVVKFNPDATQLVFSTYFPAAIQAMAVDVAGNVYVTGTTNSLTFPVTPGLPAGPVALPATLNATSAAFITKISAAGDRILYSGRISGHSKNCGGGSSCFVSSRSTVGSAIAVDPSGNAYLAGNTDTYDLPTTTGALLGTGVGAFVAKVNAAGTALVYLTYLGPGYNPVTPFTNPANSVTGIAADAAGNAYLTGSTFDNLFPATKGAYQAVLAGGTDAFAAKLNPLGTAMVWATYLGGAGTDAANGIALDGTGNVWISGTTDSPDFPNRQGWAQGGDFLAELDAAGAALAYSARLPGDTADASLAVDAARTVHFAGYDGLVSTVSPTQPWAPRIFGIANSAYGPVGGRIVGGEAISIYGPHIGPTTTVTAVADTAGKMPTLLGGVQVTINGSPIPLLYVSDSQVNAVTPLYLSGITARVRVSFNGADTADFVATLVAAIPEVFQRADGTAAAINQDGSINSPDHPAPPGSVVAIWVTGIGSTPFGVWQDGRVATGALDFGCCQVYVQGHAADVVYGGAAPGIVAGVAQVNFQLPAQLTGSLLGYGPTVDVSLSAGGVTSHAVQIYVAILEITGESQPGQAEVPLARRGGVVSRL